jgi:hypothetical protein
VTDSSDDDRPGYGRPPRKARWRKGQNGNPRNRGRKRAESLATTIDKMLLAAVPITLNGEVTKVPTIEAIMFQLLQKGMGGSERAHRVLLKYNEFANQHLEKKLEVTFVDSDYTTSVTNRAPGSEDE